MVLVGRNLPHYWKYDDDLDQLADDKPYSTVIHFFDDFWGTVFLELPENKSIKATLELARAGLQIIGSTQQHIANAMEAILVTEGPKRIIMLIEALIAIGDCTEKKTLSSLGFSQNFEEADKDRINSIYDYSFANFKSKISLKEIAGIANLSQNSFCRYFKSKTQKTYSQFITDIRIGHACKLLIENNFNVKQICYESGFNNFSSFHTAFKKVTSTTPLNYQHKFLLQGTEMKSKVI
jgi:AraC-like DNA-binding protein